MSDILSALLDDLAESIAKRVEAKLDARLTARWEPPVRQDAYRIDEAARALGLSVTEVRRRVNSGELGSRRVGRAILIPRSSIERFLASQSENGTASRNGAASRHY
jgi:excisionase family DNA binding protein